MSVKTETVVAVLNRDHCICQYCGFDGRSFAKWRHMSVDHVVPQSQPDKWKVSGKDIHSAENLAACCKHCNSQLNKYACVEDVNDIKQVRALVDKKRAALALLMANELAWYLERHSRVA